jgi:hypothetical protein
MNNEIEKRVVVTDINMPFMSMVIFMVKWVIASIPAFIILSILGAVVTGVLSTFMGSLGRY